VYINEQHFSIYIKRLTFKVNLIYLKIFEKLPKQDLKQLSFIFVKGRSTTHPNLLCCCINTTTREIYNKTYISFKFNFTFRNLLV